MFRACFLGSANLLYCPDRHIGVPSNRIRNEQWRSSQAQRGL